MLSREELSSAQNGIWMCGRHSDLIDKNTGVRYPVTTLQSWKALHEYRTAYEHSGRPATFGFVRRLTIHSSPLFEAEAVIELAKTTFIVGKNESGKTALCQWLSAVDSPRHLWRWGNYRNELDYEILFAAPSERTLRVRIPDRVPKLSLDSAAAAFNHVRIWVAYLQDRQRHGDDDDLIQFSKALHLDPVSIQSLASFIDDTSIFLKAAAWRKTTNDDGDPATILECTLKDGSTLSFGGLSGSEQGRALLDFAIAHVSNAARFSPSMLLLEFANLGMTWETFAPYLQMFGRPSSNYQTVISALKLPPEVIQLGWQVYQLVEGERGLSRIVPDV